MITLPLAIAPDHPAFPGHFPARAIVPGVVLLDHGLRTIEARFDERPDAAPWSIANAKFLSPVGPGESLRLEVEAKAAPALGYTFRIVAGDDDAVRVAVTGNVTRRAD